MLDRVFQVSGRDQANKQNIDAKYIIRKLVDFRNLLIIK